MPDDSGVYITAASFVTSAGSDGDWIINENEGIIYNPIYAALL